MLLPVACIHMNIRFYNDDAKKDKLKQCIFEENVRLALTCGLLYITCAVLRFKLSLKLLCAIAKFMCSTKAIKTFEMKHKFQ